MLSPFRVLPNERSSVASTRVPATLSVGPLIERPSLLSSLCDFDGAKVGHQRGSYFLHPRATGWFKPGELESRRDLGHTFDISLRHVTPYTPYGVLDDLVPGATYVTIMRRPVERFLSLFNFREELKREFKVCIGDRCRDAIG